MNLKLTSLSRARQLASLLLVLLCTFGNHLFAQSGIASYKLTRSTETYTPITGGSILVDTNAAYDNQISPAITIPAFTFGGVAISKVYVHANGYISFDTALGGTNYTPLSSNTTGNKGVISAFGADLGFSAGSGTSGAVNEIRYQQVGDEFIAQYTNVKRWNSSNERISFQIRINSATGGIKIIYGGPIVIGSGSATLHVGIRGNTTTWADNVNNLMIDNIPAGTSCDWSNAVTGNGNSAAALFSTANNAIVPVANMALIWTPATLAPVRTFAAVSNINSFGATISWTAVSGATQYNVQYRVPGTCAWTDYSGNPVTGNSVALTGLNPITTYQVRVQSSNATATSIWSHIPNAAGTGNGYTTTGTFSTVCTPPTPGATTASATTNLCAESQVLLSVANPVTGPGLSYQWQSSNDNVTYTNVSGATSPSYNTTPVAIYYRAKVTCSTGPDSVFTPPVQLSLHNSITGTTPATRCGIGTATLAATGNTGSSIKWYSAQTGGTILATGNSFTTPSIAATTTYYAAAETSVADTARVGSGTSTIGTTSYPNPLSAYYGGTKHQMLFLASELADQGLRPGNITSIAFDVAAVNTSGICQDFTIRMGATAVTALSAFVTGTTQVYNATYTPSATGVVTFTLSTPYNWDGVSNIIIETVHNAGNSGNGSGTTTRYTTTSFNSVYARYADGVTPAGVASFDTTTTGSTTTSTSRPNIIFGGQRACSSQRTPVTVTVTPPPAFTITANQTICNNATTPLTVTSTASNYNNYTWAPVANLFTDAAATMPYTGGNAATVYLKTATAGSLAFTASALNATSQCANIAKDTIITMPGVITATATPAVACSSGSSILTLIPSTGFGAGTTRWQSSADNVTYADITTNGAASTYTTPTLTTTTYYRNVIKNSAGAICITTPIDTVRIYHPAITATTPAARCSTGTVILGATATDGVPKWYTAATGGVAVGSGSTFTTPSLTATTTYYVSSAASSAGSATIGTGTTLTSSTGYPTAFGNRWYQDWSQMVYTAAELQSAGLTAGFISSVQFTIGAIGSAANVSNYTISLGNTTASVLSSFTTAVSPVFGPATYTSAVGQNTINFTTPYYWDGVSNLILDIRGTGINSTYNATTAYTATTSNTVVAAYSSSNNTSYYTSNPTATASTSRLNVTFGSSSGCESPRQAVTATINPNPVAAITPAGTASICEGVPTTLTASGGSTYQWLNAAGSMNGQTSATLTTANTGAYKVVATSAAGCKDTSAAVTVSSHPNPSVNLGNDTVFCSGNTLTLNAGNTGSTFLWNDNTTAQTHNVTASGTYTVGVTNSFGCVSHDSIQVTVNPTPAVSLGNPLNLCTGTSYTLNAGNAGAAYLWDNGATTQTRAINATGTYFVKVTNAYNCAASDTIQATFLNAPVINLGNDVEACASNPVTLNAGNQPGLTYLWDNGSTQATRAVTATGTYYVTASNIADCKGSDTVHVTVYPNPVVNLGNDTLVCHDITLTLDAQNPGAAYLWDNGSTERFRSVNHAGHYLVTVTDLHSCKGTDDINISVTSLPDAAINAVHGDTATYTFNLLNQLNVTAYTWDFGDGSPRVTGTYVQHRYAANGQYVVSVMLNGVCNDSATVARTVEVYELGHGATGIGNVQAGKNLQLYPSPAKDFVILESNDLHMQQITVYNVVGQKVYDVTVGNTQKHQMDISRLVSGIYTVRIETSAGTVVKKFEVLK